MALPRELGARFTLVRGTSAIEQKDMHPSMTWNPTTLVFKHVPLHHSMTATHRLTTAQHLAMRVSTNGNLATCAAAGARPLQGEVKQSG